MLFIPLILIPVLFLATALTKPRVQKYIPWNICAICIAVSTTWFLLLVLRNLGFAVDSLLLGVLMGMSITGLMIVLETIYKKNRLKHLWFVRLLTILGGLYVVIFFLQGKGGTAFLVGITSLIFLMITSFLRQGITHEDALRSAQVDDNQKSLLHKLDNCC